MTLYRVDLVSDGGQFINACYVNASTGFEARRIGREWIAEHMGDEQMLDSDGVISRTVETWLAKEAHHTVTLADCQREAIN